MNVLKFILPDFSSEDSIPYALEKQLESEIKIKLDTIKDDLNRIYQKYKKLATEYHEEEDKKRIRKYQQYLIQLLPEYEQFIQELKYEFEENCEICSSGASYIDSDESKSDAGCEYPEDYEGTFYLEHNDHQILSIGFTGHREVDIGCDKIYYGEFEMNKCDVDIDLEYITNVGMEKIVKVLSAIFKHLESLDCHGNWLFKQFQGDYDPSYFEEELDNIEKNCVCENDEDENEKILEISKIKRKLDFAILLEAIARKH